MMVWMATLALMAGSFAYAGVGWQLDAKSAPQWKAMPTWLGNPSEKATVTATDEGLRFFVPEAGKGMKWLINARWLNTFRFRYLIVRYRARGLNTKSQDYFIWVNDGSRRPQEALSLLRLSDLVSDGQWHLVASDLLALDIRPYLSQLALQVQASEPNCEVIVSEISFSDDLPEGVQLPERFRQEPLPPYRERPLPLPVLAKLQAQPTWLANPSEKASLSLTAEGIHLRVPERGCGMKWSVNFTPPLPLRETPFLILEYRAVGVALWNDYFLYTAPLNPTSPQSKYHAVWLGELIPDGKWRQLVARLPEPVLDGLATVVFQLQAEAPDAEVVIRSIKFATRPPEPTKSLEDLLPEPHSVVAKTFKPLDLTGRYNLTLRQLAPSLPVREFRFARKQVVAAGIPFLVSTDERNAIAAENELGIITVPVSPSELKTLPSEVYLLLASAFPRYEEPSLGGGQMWRVRQPYRFVVELRYADGTNEIFFPLRVLNRQPEIVEGLDVYVVPVSKALTEILLHDRMRLGEFGVCAVTLNLGKPQFDPKLWQVPSLPTAKRTPLHPAAKVQIHRRNGSIVLENGNLRVRVEASGLLSELTLLPIKRNIIVKPVPLFVVTSWDGKASISSTDYRLTAEQLTDRQAVLEWQPPDEAFPKVTLTMKMDESEAWTIEARLHNLSAKSQRWVFSLPAHWQFRIGDGDFYTYPLRTVVISDAENGFRSRYGGNLPLQFVDLSNPSLSIGVVMLTKDLQGIDRYVDLQREGQVTTIGIRWRCDPIAPNETLNLPTIEFAVHSGDWKVAFERYKAWVRTWYRPIVPRKNWFRKVFAFRQDYIREGLFDFTTKTYHFAERIELARNAFGACDYLHIFDWGATLERGRTGDYDPWGNRLTTPDEFRKAVEEAHAQGVPVGLYIEGYLVDVRSRVGKAHREDWGLRMRNGEVEPWEPGHPEFVMCPGSKGWRDYLTSVYRRVRDETGALGFYIDQFGFTWRDCFAQNHEHPPDWNVLRGEGILTRQIREALPPECVVYTENFPPDIHTILQDGSFDYAINFYQNTAHRWMPVPVRLGRFAFPDFKVLQIIVCDHPTGSNEEAVKQVFFNGDGYWLQGEPESWFTPEVLALLRKCIAILREHADAFTSDDCEPLVPTLAEGVFANRFSSDRKTVWTLYNANWKSVNGEILAVPHIEGARYFDAWNGREIAPRIVGKIAYLSLTIEPHSVGCVVRER